MPLLLFEQSAGGGSDQPSLVVTLLSPEDEQIENPISSIISEYLPNFVRDDHSGFVRFVEAYYEWMEKKENPYGTSATLMDTLDVDRTLDSFIDYFKETYLHDFPKTFATSVSGNKVNQKTVLKNINDFYKAKGTEKSYNLLFKILHDSDVSFYYPKEDLLRVSDGKWVEKKSIKITSENGNSNFSIRNRTVEQIDPSLNGAVTAYANVDNVYQYELNQYKITELFLTDINGTFTQGSKVQCTLADGTKIIEEIYTVPSNVTISNGGLGYKSGDTIEIDTTSSDYVSGSGAKGSVTRVSNTGIIQTAQIDNFGVNYQSNNDSNSIPVTFTSGSGFGASGSVDLDALCTYPGYYANNDGKLSSNKRMRDNELYQEYSYVLKTEISLSAYKEQVKKLVHPAGTKLFGNISVFDTVSTATPYSTQVNQRRIPILGRYAPYTFETQDNLRSATGSGSEVDLYPRGFNPGATSPNHCLGNTGGRLNVASTGDGGFTVGSFVQGEIITASSSGATGKVFGWHRNSATGGVIFVYTGGTGGVLGFAGTETITAAAGHTASLTAIQLGNGTVYEFDSPVHVTGGAALTAGATAFGATAYWDVESSPQVDSNTTLAITVQKFTTTSGYTAGYDFTIGNVATQGPDSNGNISRGIVKDWIPGASGSTSNTLKIQLTSGDNFAAGTINEIDNKTGSISVSYTVSGSMVEEANFRNKIKHIKLDDFLTLTPTWQYHSDHGYTI